jgi:GT2 family glycosyltransferase
MTTAAITITYNRLELTKRTVESFYEKTNVDYHLFIDNGSTDGTQEYLKQFNHILLDKNYGIAYAFREAFRNLQKYDFILKLDNDVETVSNSLVELMVQFFMVNGMEFVCSPVDLNLDPKFAPRVRDRGFLNGYNYTHTTHTGGAYQLIPYRACEKLCKEFRHLQAGDYMIGKYFNHNAYSPTYLTDLQMRHIGIDQSTPADEYIL